MALPANIPGPPAPSRPGGWDETKWTELLRQPGGPARNAALAALLEKLAAIDPQRAMALAAAETNLKFRESLTQAALHGWARKSPGDAAAWALALTDSNRRETALATVFAGAIAADPEGAIRIGSQIIARDPDDAIGYGSQLIDALCANGNFGQAAQMASGADPATRSAWMAEAYSQWAQFQPEQAATAAAALTDPDARSLALHGIVGGWSEADPAALIQFVTQLPAGPDQDALLSQSLERWVKEDPQSASQWINNRSASAVLDQGVSTVATMETIPPAVAVTWAQSIVNPQLRSQTLADVLRAWLSADPAAAQAYFDSTDDLLPDDRSAIAAVIAAAQGQATAP